MRAVGIERVAFLRRHADVKGGASRERVLERRVLGGLQRMAREHGEPVVPVVHDAVREDALARHDDVLELATEVRGHAVLAARRRVAELRRALHQHAVGEVLGRLLTARRESTRLERLGFLDGASLRIAPLRRRGSLPELMRELPFRRGQHPVDDLLRPRPRVVLVGPQLLYADHVRPTAVDRGDDRVDACRGFLDVAERQTDVERGQYERLRIGLGLGGVVARAGGQTEGESKADRSAKGHRPRLRRGPDGVTKGRCSKLCATSR